MRYWVYINDKVIEKPFEEGELASIPGFNGDTLVCKETPAEGETQEWMPARLLIEAYKQPAPPPPPAPQTIAKFAKKESAFAQDFKDIQDFSEEKEPKNTRTTILSAKIFGDLQEDKERASKEDDFARKTNAALGKTETLSPQEQKALEEEQKKLKEELYYEPPTELVSIDEVEEIDVDNNISEDAETEEEVLKTALRSIIYTEPKNKKQASKTLKAVDIRHNKDIDLSEDDEEEEKEEDSQKIKDIAQTELQPLGDKKPLTHLFDKQEDKASEDALKEKENNQEEENLSEEEFLPEEEISIDDGEEEPLKEDIISKDKEDSKEVQDIMKELEQEKTEDLQEEETQEEFEEAFTTSPALVAETQEESAPQEETLTSERSFLEPAEQKEEDKTEHPATLEELTDFPVKEEEQRPEQELKEKQEKEEEEGVFIPAEVHPDVVVEQIKEETPVQAEENKTPLVEETISEKDNFLNTFSTDIETVFLDQPTAFISDYIPPEETGDKKDEMQEAFQEAGGKDGKSEILDIKSSQGQHQVSLQNVRRVKPAVIKTVPMVEGEQADPFSQTQIRNIEVAEEAMAKVEKKNNIINLIKTFGLIFGFLFMIIFFVALIAQIGVIPKDFSPLHAFLTKKDTNADKKASGGKKLTPEEMALQDLKDAEELRIKKIVDEVKKYKLFEGITLEEKIKLLHPNDFDKLEWSASILPEDITYYAVKVSLPANPEGYTPVNYRFNYNTVNYTVEATTSEANNIMNNPYKAPAGQTQQQAQTQQATPAQTPQQSAQGKK